MCDLQRMVCRALTAIVLIALAARACPAADESPGQAELDKALEARIDAKNLAELAEVVSLCRSALKKGLDDDGLKLANQILASTLYQRGEAMAQTVLAANRPDPRLPQIRTAALVDLKEAVSIDSDLPQAQLLIARLELLPGGDIAAAGKALDAALKSKNADGPLRSKVYTYRSVLHTKPEDRLADLDLAVQADPSDPQPLRLRAALKLALNKPAEAVVDFDAALKLDPENAATHEARGLALATQQKWEEARESLSKATELAPQSTTALIQRGRVALLMGDPKAALADAEAALKTAPGLIAALLLRAQSRHGSGDKAGALADVNLILEKAPDNGDALRTRAMMRVAEGEADRAIEDLERLLKLASADKGVMLQLAVLYNGLRKSDRAVELASKVLEMDEKMWQAMRVRADAYLNLSKHGDAVKDYEAALKLEPKDAGLLNNLAWVLATSPDAKVRNGKRAVELADLACELTDHKAAHILSTLAAGHAECGDFEAARKWTKRALDAAQTDDERVSLRKEMASYEKSQPWREDKSDGPAAETDKSKLKESAASKEVKKS